MKVLVNAGPWLDVPPRGYGGIENVLAALIPELRRRGVQVVLATVRSSSLPVDERLAVYGEPQFSHLQRPYNRVTGIAHAHMHLVVRELRGRSDIDLVHDHVEAAGPTVLAAMGGDTPPVLHTLHWDLLKHRELYDTFDGGGRLFVNGVSASQLARAPEALRRHSVGHVHLATPLAEGADRRTTPAKSDHVVVLGRITACKGQHIAARLAHKADVRLILAGPVGPYHDERGLRAALGRTTREQNPDVRYWLDQVAHCVDGERVRWIGSVSGRARDEVVATARASLFPIQWEEPGGTALVESLALGTPIVGFRRGCLPELVDEGRTGLLVDGDDEDELARCLRGASELDVEACRHAAARRFAPAVMAERYLGLYDDVLSRACQQAAKDKTPALSHAPGR
ncbi:MAG: glycosyltransferase [Actinomycetota bacterium]|nr:glycosyltransferase [Actinomycetota bacterium]